MGEGSGAADGTARRVVEAMENSPVLELMERRGDAVPPIWVLVDSCSVMTRRLHRCVLASPGASLRAARQGAYAMPAPGRDQDKKRAPGKVGLGTTGAV